MTPEERKAIAMCQLWQPSVHTMTCDLHYPKCCSYHEGFDAALALLEPVGWVGVDADHESGEWFFHYEDEDATAPEFDGLDGKHIDGYVEVRTVFAIKATP